MHPPAHSTRIPPTTARMAALLFVILALGPGAWASGIEPSREARAGLDLLHTGRFREAAATFETVSKRSPGDPEGPLLEGLTTWWRLLDNPKDTQLLETLLAHLEEATRRGEALEGTRDAQRGRILGGTAQMLAAQTQASLKDYFAAGSAARRGHKLLEAAIEADPGAADAGFAMGAYKYFAARMSWIVRLLRFVIMLPGGSEEEGLAALQKAAGGGKFFATESNLLLAYIYSSDDENDMRRGLGYLDAARRSVKDSPLLDVVQSRFLFSLGELSQAESAARRSLEASEKLQGVAAQVPALARLRLGLALYYEYRPSESLDAIAPLLAGGRELLPEGSADTLDSLAARLESDLARAVETQGTEEPDANGGAGTPAVKRLAAAPVPADPNGLHAIAKLREGDARSAVETLKGVVDARPNDMVSRYHLARAYEAAGESEKAVALLGVVTGPDARIPKTLRGWALIRLGVAEAARGRLAEARAYYDEASKLSGFVFRRAAADRLKNPAPGPPQG